MPLKFYNIRSKEIRVAETEPMIAALWSSSDRGPNVSQGQDFGWRLAPEVVVELKRIKADPAKIQAIAVRYNLPIDAVDEKAILQYISARTALQAAPVAQEGDYEDEYRDEIRNLEQEQKQSEASAREATQEQPTTTTTTQPVTTTTTTKAKS